MRGEAAVIHTLVLPMPPPMRSANAYLVEGDRLTLVDTGPKSPKVLEALKAALAAVGHALADIDQVVITHPHLDHFGLARQIVAESGVKVLVHAQGVGCLTDYEGEQVRLADLSASHLRESDAPEGAWGILRLRTLMYKCFAESVPVDRVEPLDDGQTLSLGGMQWQVLPTPGHCLGHISLYQADKGLLISGDCLLPDYSFIPVPYPVPVGGTGSSQVSEFAHSLELLGRLDVREVLPGHGPRAHNAGALIARERANLTRSRDGLAEALGNGRQTAYQLWRECLGAYQTYDVLTGIEVVGSYLGAMQGEGAVASWEEGDRITYSRIH
jgi:glyoxylase-like metal-dependent hydrolase (beta-lactamase superfamily II)